MNIIIGKYVGFCYGVKRAVDGTMKIVNDNRKIYCLGELVHNKQVILRLQENNIEIIDNIEDAKEDSIVIVRAHGVSKDVYELAKEKNIELIDYTCPNVLNIHKIIDEYVKKDYYIFVVGVDNHPETIGNISYCENNYSLITKEEDIDLGIDDFNNSNKKKLLVIFQTTYNMIMANNIIEIIKRKISEGITLEVKNTICPATENRQREVNIISKKVDMMIVVGGKNSSNTKKLYDIAVNNCRNTLCVETWKDLENINFYNNQEIGVVSGASTPLEIVLEIVNYIKGQENDNE